MKFLNTRLKKIIFWTLAIVTGLVALVVIFISPLTKWAIEKYDVQYTGREITLDLAYVNPFSGKVYFKNLVIREAGSDSVFFSTAGLSVNFEMWKMLSKTYEISEATLNEPVIKVIQDKKEFNFNDIIDKFSSKDSVPRPKTGREPVHFNFLNAKIKNGTFYYVERSMSINYFIRDVNIETGGKRWDVDTMGFRYSFVSGIGQGGDMSGRFDIHLGNMDFKLTSLIHRFDLSVLEQYVKDIANYAKVRGTLDADLEAKGNFKNSQNLVARGPLAINDFHFGKSVQEDYFSFRKAAVSIIELSPSNKRYFFDSISVVNPYFKYERYDHLDNLQDMFGEKGEAVKESQQVKGKTNILFEIGNYVQQLAKNFFRSDYKVKRLAVYSADIRYNDFTLNEKFAAAVSPLTLIADSIERGDKWVDLNLHTGLKPYGNFALNLSINPRDSSDFILDYKLRNVSMAMFNPYLVTFTSFPVDRGIIEFTGQARVNNGVIDCNNHLVIIDPRVNNRQKRNGSRWLPLRVFMFLVRERGNVIDYEVPIRGDLRDPKFKIRDIVFDVLRNVFVKPVTVPYAVKVRNVENEIEKSLSLKWVMRGAGMNPPQEKFIKKIAGFLAEHPDETISVIPELYAAREKEYILFFEAKKKYYLQMNKLKAAELKEKDSISIERLSIRDSAFIFYLDKKTDKKLHTLQQKCLHLVGEEAVSSRLKLLNKQRREFFLSFFKEGGSEKRVKLLALKDTVPYNGFSQYRIRFKNEMPEEVSEAYSDINELDSNSPRNRFKDARAKHKQMLDRK